jgi:LPS export ABC transporter protein LptC
MVLRLQTIFLFAACTVVFLSCENDAKEVADLTRKTQEVEVGRNIKGTYSQSALKKAELLAPLMYRVKADTPYAEFPKSIHVNFFKENHQVESVVDAKYAKYFETLGKVFLRDSVVVYNTTGDTLNCDDLWWDQNLGIFYTDNKVLIRTKTQHLNGTGLWALSNFSKYTIKNTTGIVDVPQQIQP